MKAIAEVWRWRPLYMLTDDGTALAHAAAEGFAAGNAARRPTMLGAPANIERRLDLLAGEERGVRQEVISSELLDLLAGSLAVEPPANPGSRAGGPSPVRSGAADRSCQPGRSARRTRRGPSIQPDIVALQ